MVNIDGYVYSWTSSSTRMWRKNRRNNGNNVFGVDLNRNHGPARTWCTSGSSRVPSSDTYCGTAPFSEPEIAGIRSFIDSRPEIQGGVDFHTVGPLLLWPWQYTYDRVPQRDYLMFSNIFRDVANAINLRHGQRYVSQQGSDLYPHSGGFIDYNYEINGQITTTIELRGQGFVTPRGDIVLSGEENYQGFLVLARHVLERPRK